MERFKHKKVMKVKSFEEGYMNFSDFPFSCCVAGRFVVSLTSFFLFFKRTNTVCVMRVMCTMP